MILLPTDELPANLTCENRYDSLDEMMIRVRKKIQNRDDLLPEIKENHIKRLEQLSQTEVGRFLLKKGGANGFWAEYFAIHPEKRRALGTNHRGAPLSETEIFLFERAPTALAHQERFKIFKVEAQKRMYEGTCCASIPCGLMGDLLGVDYFGIQDYTLIGIDLDPDSLEKAAQNATMKGVIDHCLFWQKDAWNLDLFATFDFITSNGLNFCERKDERVVELYRQFFNALKRGGSLILSFLTPPPNHEMETEWLLEKVNQEDADLEKVFFLDLIDGRFQAFRSEKTTKEQLYAAGFIDLEIIYDKAHIFPTIIAKKP